MSRRQTIFVITMTLVLCAGVVVGRLTTHVPVAPPHHNGEGPSWIAQQLGLTTEQKQQMDAIWAETRQKMDQSFEHRRELDKQRDNDVQALLSDQQRTAFAKINSDYRSQRNEMDKQRETLIHDANVHSRALLDTAQQKKWDELTKDMHSHRGPRRPGGSPDTHSSATQPG